MAATASHVQVTVLSVSGEVLLGPAAAVSSSETASDLKRRLPDRGDPGSEGAWHLLLRGRELLDRERLSSTCEQDAVNEMTAVAVLSTGAALSRSLAEAREQKARLREGNERWLRECDDASDDRKQEQREQDIQSFRDARQILLQEIEEEALLQCRKAARMGKNATEVHLENLQMYELGAMFYFVFHREIRGDPIMRGWYYSTHENVREPRDVPETLQLKSHGLAFGSEATDHSLPFIRALAVDLVAQLERQGLRVLPGSCLGVLVLSFGENGEEPSCCRGVQWW